MIKAVIIDDEPLARALVKEYLQHYTQIEVVQECNDGFEGVKAINQHQPSLIFLDIQMPKINGFEMLELLENPPAVIFTTAFDEYALNAFEAHAVDYLLKPFSKERFDKAMEKFLDTASVHQQKENTEKLVINMGESALQAGRVVVKTGGKIRIIPISTIDYLEAADDYVKIFSQGECFLKKRTMSFFEKSLPKDQFIRTHRSYIINIHQITRIDPYEKDGHVAVLRSGVKIPVSKSGYSVLREVLGL